MNRGEDPDPDPPGSAYFGQVESGSGIRHFYDGFRIPVLSAFGHQGQRKVLIFCPEDLQK